MSRRYSLREDQWERIQGLRPGRAGHVGVTARDNRLFLEAVLYRYRAGIPWRDLPERFGDFRVVHLRHMRWSRSGVWQRVVEPLLRVGKSVIIPSLRSRKREYDRHLYKARHLIENFFARLKQYRAITTRYDKTRTAFLGAIHLAAAVIWLN